MSNARQAIRNKKNDFYASTYPSLMIVLMAEIILVLLLMIVVLYQIFHRPLPVFWALAPNHQRMELTASNEPNLLSSTLIAWASKAAVAAYTFDFVNFNKEINQVRPYFTEKGWNDYRASIGGLIQTITQNKIFVNGVVTAPPVISNQGDLSGHGYTWRVQIPFLVSYQSSDAISRARYMVVVTLVRVPTSANPAGIGIDQFVMTSFS